MDKLLITIFVILTVLILSCDAPNPNTDKTGQDELKSLELDYHLNKNKMIYQDLIYVPIYSDIYVDAQSQKSLLAATLSIRNTSYEDSLFVSKIDYFDTHGTLVRSYLEHTISLPPMSSVNYVVERDDDTGGPGANFMVALTAKNKTIMPLIQAVMVGHRGNIGFAFSTDGYSIIKAKQKAK